MNQDEVEERIQSELKSRGKKALDRNAIKAFLMMFASPTEALGQIFLGRDDALNEEKARIQQDIVLDLLCSINEAVAHAEARSKDNGVSWTIVDGTIEAVGSGVKEVTGAKVAAESGPVEFKPGTHIKAKGENADKVTGLSIGERTNS